ncbi:MAG: hypothetical protein A3G33_07445 [Omnitrophica bacterium RIFCSPLOWO2_12_FULL_44_17]|uniref:Phosphatidate cytidylyltransferase n=1 Tax=Candidatus Danuiimicrobium aquiferis TaxID=1801832 RepID=A0A1G1KYS7_9BACT|nr:MAG: hypothetical protein A3B72_07745 [Omnitrophica bacterium RIFCSPHIGHO2_02_FULL_45_28]OGW88847.1 MAG: hypothetical protein A3E74_00985 [Omnitrophica bacterium RIFCSPHIGHO2_12_FULL_44_12]OGW98058.1 MAG: hypothetical protein A3G33_07445 [Omnitrophica bacterium RIFCSPLOWO2_12_FULL_44_17]OGX03500.1 MAG: hypothetical protein A3J12_02785 [Omnitrophica bacterium RIFCSPLOWO2_02_FULL_44_11]
MIFEKMTQLEKRLISSLFIIIATSYAIFYASTLIFLAVTEVIIVIGLLEYFNLAERKGLVINRYLGVFFAALLSLPMTLPTKTMILTIAVLCIFIFNFHRKLRENALVSTAVTLFGIIYVGWFFSFISQIRSLPDGSWWIFYLLFMLKMGDAAAFFVGRKYGVHKYIVHISPNKSIEGAIAGFVMTMLCSLTAKFYLPEIHFMDLAILGFVLGILGQFGDLAESLLKRDANIKDSGIIPGLGGILDVIDSLLLTIPVLYYYLTVILDLSAVK